MKNEHHRRQDNTRYGKKTLENKIEGYHEQINLFTR